jgi:hypothetical protein
MDTQVAELLGGERVLAPSVKSNLDLARAIRQGLPAETAVESADLILDFEQIPITLLDTSAGAHEVEAVLRVRACIADETREKPLGHE